MGIFADFVKANLCREDIGKKTTNLICQNGHCVLSGSGECLIDSINAETLTIAPGTNENNLGLYITANGNHRIGTLIINRNKDNTGITNRVIISKSGECGARCIIRVGSVRRGSSNVTNPLDVKFNGTAWWDDIFILENTDGTDNVKVITNAGQIIQKPGTGPSNGNENAGGSIEIPPNATTEEITNAILNYANALNEQLNLESANAMILYNILNNYDGTYINYDYGFGNQVGIGAFNNGGFFRYYNKDSQNGFDVGAKYKIQVANRFYLRGAVYYMGFASTHSIVAGMGLLKDIDFALGSSGKAFFVLNPSLNIYYAATLKGKYMPTNHLGFFNAGLETGLRIKKTSLLVRGSAGGAINSLKNIRADLGKGAIYTNKTYFNNALYSASFVLHQGIGRFYLSGEVGGVFFPTPYLKAGALLGYEFGKKDTRETRKSVRYQKAQKKTNIRKTLSNPPANAANARANSQKPSNNNAKSTKPSNTNNATSNANNTAAKAPAQTQRGLLRKKVNLPKVPASTKSNNATSTNAKSSDTKSNNTSTNNTRARQSIRAVNNSKAK